MEQMPDELLLIIFKNLPSVFLAVTAARVCQRWKKLIEYKHKWIQNIEQVDAIDSHVVTVCVLHHIPSLVRAANLTRNLSIRAYCLRELTIYFKLPLDKFELVALESLENLHHLDIFVKPILSITTPMPPNLNSLVVNNTMSKEFLYDLENYKKITSFHMFGMSYYYHAKAMRNFLSAHQTHLTDLTLRCNELGDTGYAAVGACGSLRRLRLFGCWLLTRAGAEHLARPAGLRALHLTGARMVRRQALHDLLITLPPRIEELNLSSSSFIDEHCATLVGRLPKLKRLELWRCNVSSSSMLLLVKSLTSLEHLDTDITLDRRQLEQLAGRDLKIRPRQKNQYDDKFGVNAIRGGGEGYSADRFYYWAADFKECDFQANSND